LSYAARLTFLSSNLNRDNLSTSGATTVFIMPETTAGQHFVQVDPAPYQRNHFHIRSKFVLLVTDGSRNSVFNLASLPQVLDMSQPYLRFGEPVADPALWEYTAPEDLTPPPVSLAVAPVSFETASPSKRPRED
jgi:hypothetical protein